MTETFQATIDLTGIAAVGVEGAVEHRSHGLTLFRELQVFHGHQLGNRETVMDFTHGDLGLGIFHPGLIVGALCRDTGGLEVGAVPALMAGFDAVGYRNLQCLDGNQVVLAQAPGDLRCGNDGAGGAVAHTTAIEQPDGLCYIGRIQHLFLGDFTAQVGLRILDAIGVALDRDVGHGALEVGLV